MCRWLYDLSLGVCVECLLECKVFIFFGSMFENPHSTVLSHYSVAICTVVVFDIYIYGDQIATLRDLNLCARSHYGNILDKLASLFVTWATMFELCVQVELAWDLYRLCKSSLLNLEIQFSSLDNILTCICTL